jgi:hypothetical protein
VIELRLRTRVSAEELAEKKGKIVTERDYNVLLTRAARVYRPDGGLLCVYVPGAVAPDVREAAYRILTTIRGMTNNRGMASGSKRVARTKTQSMALPVMSSILGYIEPQGGRFPYARRTAWTEQHRDEFRALEPYLQAVAAVFRDQVPERHAAQMAAVARTRPEWVIPGTPFSTITVNNTYPCGVHQDAGDLKDGFSVMGTLRRGQYRGGVLVLPEWRVAADLQDGDVILFDPHEWHGNTLLEPASEDAERISVPCYFRAKLQQCGSFDEELRRARRPIEALR